VTQSVLHCHATFPISFIALIHSQSAYPDSKLHELKLLIAVSRSLFQADTARTRRWVCVSTLQVYVPDVSRGIVVGREGYGLDTQTMVFRFPVGARNFSPV
jgi:hypothetical protein